MAEETMKEFWFDLEGTVIDSFDNNALINCESISKFIAANKIESISIFSFAIWNDRDKAHFLKWIKPQIEQTFEVTVIEVPTCEEMMKIIFRNKGIDFTLSEMISIWGKSRTFKDFILNTGKEGEFILIDDVVQDTCEENFSTRQIVKTINVNRIIA